MARVSNPKIQGEPSDGYYSIRVIRFNTDWLMQMNGDLRQYSLGEWDGHYVTTLESQK